MAAELHEPADKLRALRCDVGYYKTMHARAVEREVVLRQRVCELEERNARQEERIRELLKANEKLLARVAWLETQLFGRKSQYAKILRSAASRTVSSAVFPWHLAPTRRNAHPRTSIATRLL